MKALNDIQLPRTSALSSTAGQKERMNQQRLNENFRMISEAFFENEERMAALPKEILAQIGNPINHSTQSGLSWPPTTSPKLLLPRSVVESL